MRSDVGARAKTEPELFSIEIEQAILGAFLIDPYTAKEAAPLLEAHEFYDPLHGRMWAAMAVLRSRGADATVFTIGAHLAADEGLKEVGGKNYLANLARCARRSRTPKGTQGSFASLPRDGALLRLPKQYASALRFPRSRFRMRYRNCAKCPGLQSSVANSAQRSRQRLSRRAMRVRYRRGDGCMDGTSFANLFPRLLRRAA